MLVSFTNLDFMIFATLSTFFGRYALAVKRATCVVDLMRCLPQLRDPQSELLILRSCMGVAKVLFGLRTFQPPFVRESVSIFDNGINSCIVLAGSLSLCRNRRLIKPLSQF